MKIELKIVDLLARNAEKKFTINEAAKAIKGYYSFVYKTINKLAGEGIVTRTKAGKAYLCSLNFEKEKTLALIQLSEIEKKSEFYDKNKKLKLILEDFTESSKSRFNILSVVLFGSHSKGNATKESDIDLAIVSEDFRGK